MARAEYLDLSTRYWFSKVDPGVFIGSIFLIWKYSFVLAPARAIALA
jgi:hypothetical protein